MISKVKNTIEQYNMFSDCKNIIVGLSGGADSVCLLLVLSEIIQLYDHDIKITAVHVNHMLRGENADKDEEYVRKLCFENGIDIKVKKIDVRKYSGENKISEEMAGRNIRYDFFNEISCELPLCKIAVAHNYDDRAETILMNIIRGTGLKGLKGIPYTRENIIRPLLDIPKKDIMEYCIKAGINVCEDESNTDIKYIRNRTRIELIPYINELYDTDISDRIIRMGNNVSKDDEFLSEYAEKSYSECVSKNMYGDIILDRKMFRGNHTAIKNRILQMIYNEDIEQIHINLLLEFIEKSKAGKKLNIKENMTAVNKYENIVFTENKNIAKIFSFEYEASGEFLLKELNRKISCNIYDCGDELLYNNIDNSVLKSYFDYDKITGKAVVRNRREKDVFYPYKGVGRKKLKEYFINNKIPSDERNKIILLADGSDIMWVSGYRVSNEYVPTKDTKRVLCVEITN